jgi:hypothetical protein
MEHEQRVGQINRATDIPINEKVWLNKDEVKVVDPKSGGVKAAKLARFSLIPAEFLWFLAEHYGKGAKKYADRNWEKGYKWSLTLDAMQRHIALFCMGERYDNHKPDCPPDCPEHTGSHHIIAAAWHCVALFIFDLRNIGTNDLFKETE